MTTSAKWIFYCAVVIIALLLKYHYSNATPQHLRWILSPTASAVGVCQDDHYSWESGEGYISNDRKTIIAPACAGINFLIIVFCITSFKILSSAASIYNSIFRIVFSMIVSYMVTIMVNAIRITTASMLFQSSSPLLSSSSMHRIHGTAIFLLMLYLYDSVLKRLTPTTKTTRAWTLRIYAAVTLGIPLCLGLFRGYTKEFSLHIITVLFTASVITITMWICKRFLSRAV